MLVAHHGIPGFGTGIDTVKYFGIFFKIKDESLKVLVPVWILDDHFYIWIYSFCRPYDKVLCNFSHQVQTILCPTSITFIIYGVVGFTICKEKIIEDDLIKILCCVFSNFLCFFTMLGIIITKRLEITGLYGGISNPSGYFYALVVEKLLGNVQRLLVNNKKITVSLKINFIDFYLSANLRPSWFEIICCIGHLTYILSRAINRYFKVLVLLGKACHKKCRKQNN